MMDPVHKEMNGVEFTMLNEIELIFHMEDESVKDVLHGSPRQQSYEVPTELFIKCALSLHHDVVTD